MVRWVIIVIGLALSGLLAACSSAPAAEPTEEPLAQPAEPSPAPAASPTLPPPTRVAQDTLLPAPLFFLDGGELVRLAADGRTRTLAARAAGPITEFDISPRNGALAYLAQAAAPGSPPELHYQLPASEPLVLFTGPVLAPLFVYQPLDVADPERVAFRVTQPLEGLEIGRAVSPSGIFLAVTTGLRPSRLTVDDGPLPPAEPQPGDRSLAPFRRAPNHEHVLLRGTTLPNDSFLAVYDPTRSTTATVTLTTPDGAPLPCCDAAWSQNSQAIYVATYSPLNPDSPVPIGVWRADATNGQATLLMPAAQPDGTYRLAVYPNEQPDGQLVAFVAEVAQLPDPFSNNAAPRYALHQLAADGSSTSTPLRSDGYIVRNVLWAPDGSGAVAEVVDDGASAESGPTIRLLWLPTNGDPAVELAQLSSPQSGSLRWGMPNDITAP